MKRYSLDKFPETVLRPEVVAKHEMHRETLAPSISGYVNVGHRDTSIFDWLLRVFENLSLSTVDPKFMDSLAVIKTKFSMFVILLDDTVDNADKRNFDLYTELVKIPFHQEHCDSSRLSEDEAKYLEFSISLWNDIIKEVKSYPKYEKYRNAFEFDMQQIVNSMDYSKFVNVTPNAVNLLENGAYVHHAMIVLMQLDFDLMCSDGFDDKELGAMRELAYLSQKMARIGNVIGTYPRELVEEDMSSEALIRFRQDFGDIARRIENEERQDVRRYLEFEEELAKEWESQYSEARILSLKVKSIDMQRYLEERKFIQDAYRSLVEQF